MFYISLGFHCSRRHCHHKKEENLVNFPMLRPWALIKNIVIATPNSLKYQYSAQPVRKRAHWTDREVNKEGNQLEATWKLYITEKVQQTES